MAHEEVGLQSLLCSCTVLAWESGQGWAEVEAAAVAGEGWGGMHHSTTALRNFDAAQYGVFGVTEPCWD